METGHDSDTDSNITADIDEAPELAAVVESPPVEPTQDKAADRLRFKLLLPAKHSRQDIKELFAMDEPKDNWQFRPISDSEVLLPLIGRMHFINGRSLKASCSMHDECKCHINVGTTYHVVRNALIDWIRLGQFTTRDQHLEKAASCFDLFS